MSCEIKLENCYSLLSMPMQQTSKSSHVLDLLSAHFSLIFFLSFLSGQEWGQVIIFIKILEFQIMPTHFHNQLEVFD